jgi:hypothetical protein
LPPVVKAVFAQQLFIEKAMPISWKGTLIQYSGRLHRRHPAKTEVRVYDYVDREVPVLLRMFEKRLSTYRGEIPAPFRHGCCSPPAKAGPRTRFQMNAACSAPRAA